MQSVTPWLVVVVLVVVLFSGGLFGYDQGVISGALHGIKATFALSPLLIEVVTTWAIGGVNVVATLIAIAVIDRLGRRKLMLAGLSGMALCLIVVGVAFRFIGPASVSATASATAAAPNTAGILALVALVGFVVSFAFSMGPVTWTVINEIFPGHIRGRAVAVATAINWGSAFLVSQFFLTVIGTIGHSWTFLLFALFCVIAWAWIYVRVPETKGQSLEEIQQLWKEAKT
ncbi:MAG: MFS transporter [Nitrobacter sp.]